MNLDKWVEAALHVKHGGPGLSEARSELEQESLAERVKMARRSGLVEDLQVVLSLEAQELDGEVLPVVRQLHVGREEVVAVAVPLQRLPAPIHVHAEPVLMELKCLFHH